MNLEKAETMSQSQESLIQLLAGVEEIVQEILYSGIQYINAPLLQKLNLYFHHASKINHFRLATSLRYIRIELERFQSKPETFSVDRLMLFVSQTWMLLQKTRSLVLNHDQQGIDQLMANQAPIKKISKIEGFMVGLRQHLIKDSIMGFTFYFVLDKKAYQGSIYTLDFIMKYMSTSSLDHLLFQAYKPKGSAWAPNLYSQVRFEHITLDVSAHKIRLTDESTIQRTPLQPIVTSGLIHKGCEYLTHQYEKLQGKKQTAEKDSFPENDQRFLDKYEKWKQTLTFQEQAEHPALQILKTHFLVEKIEEVMETIQTYEIAPFDTPETFAKFLLLCNVKIRLQAVKEDSEKAAEPMHYYEIISDLGIPFLIKIETKGVHREMQQALDEFQTTSTTMDYLLGFYYLFENALHFYPLSVFQQEEMHYLALSKTTNLKIKKDLLEWV